MSDAEHYVLGCLMQHEGEAALARLAHYGVDAAWWTDPVCKPVWSAIEAMIEARQVVLEPHALADAVKRASGDDILPRLYEMESAPVSVSSINYYLDLMLADYQRRRLVALAKDIERGAADDEPPLALVGRLHEEALSIADLQAKETTKEKHLLEVRTELEQAKKSGGTGLPDPWMGLQAITHGAPKGGTRLIAGGTKQGKTTVGLQIASHWAMADHPGAIISLEMREKMLRHKAAAGMTGENLEAILSGEARKHQLDAHMDAYASTMDWPMAIYDGAKTIEQVLALIHGSKGRWEWVMIDYLQKLSRSRHDPDGEYAAISRWTSEITSAIYDADMSGLVLVQLNRSMHLSVKPHYHQSKGSSGIEQDCSQFMMVYQDPDCGDDILPDNAPTYLDIQLARMGRVDRVKMVFEKSKHRMVPEIGYDYGTAKE